MNISKQHTTETYLLLQLMKSRHFLPLPPLLPFLLLSPQALSNFLSGYLVGFTQEKKTGILKIPSNNNQ